MGLGAQAITQDGMKSLGVFLKNYPKSFYEIKISEGMFGKQEHLREIPVYRVKNI
jgi:hypothetical protein